MKKNFTTHRVEQLMCNHLSTQGRLDVQQNLVSKQKLKPLLLVIWCTKNCQKQFTIEKVISPKVE
jgi:hypothetical protein